MHGGFPHHSFHVLNVWRETNHELLHGGDWSAVAECIVSWGKVSAVSGPFIDVVTEPLLGMNGENSFSAHRCHVASSVISPPISTSISLRRNNGFLSTGVFPAKFFRKKWRAVFAPIR